MDQFLPIAAALLTLTAMEIVLGIDNIVFIAIITQRLPREQQKLGRRIGLSLALLTRIALLATLSWIMAAEEPFMHWTDVGLPESWFEVEHDGETEISEDLNGVSVRDLILFFGGLFLIAKSVFEIHERLTEHGEKSKREKVATFASVVVQIAILDLVFSLDSVITAVGMADDLWVMVTAVIVAMIIMLIFSEVVARFVEKNPTIKMLALSFLILIGVMLVAEGAGAHMDKGYIYFAMVFALIVEFLNLKLRSNKPAVSGAGPAK